MSISITGVSPFLNCSNAQLPAQSSVNQPLTNVEPSKLSGRTITLRPLTK